jgi:two-component system catabolic regulation response regulator CreB
MKKILVFSVVEKERLRISRVLAESGFDVSATDSYKEAPNRLRTFRPDGAVIVNSAPEVQILLTRLRKMSMVPFLVIGPPEQLEVIQILELGADRYLFQPVSSRELVARLKAVLRAYDKNTGNDVESSLLNERVQGIDITAGLTPKEYSLFSCLLNKKGQLMPFKRLLIEVWSGKTGIDTLHHHARQLKMKLDRNRDCPYRLLSYRGQGYCLCETNTAVNPDS